MDLHRPCRNEEMDETISTDRKIKLLYLKIVMIITMKNEELYWSSIFSMTQQDSRVEIE